MKKFYLKTLLMAGALLVGSNAWAETTTVYERGASTAWTAEDVATFTVSGATLSYSETMGMTFNAQTANSTFYARKTLTHTDNSIVSVDVVWNGYSNTSASYSQGAYFQFGKIFVYQNDQGQNSGYGFGGMGTTAAGTFKHGDYRKGTSPNYHIQFTIDTSTNTLTAFKISSGDDATTWVNLTEDITLPSYDYTTLEFGFNKTTRTTNAKSSSLISVNITETPQEVTSADYTINYTYNGETVKSTIGESVVGNTIYAESPITVDGTKYYATDDATLSLVITSGTNTLDVPLRLANTFSYTVNAVDASDNILAQIATGTTTEGESDKVYYSEYYLSGTTLYKMPTDNNTYYKTVTPTVDGSIFTIKTTETPIENVVFYADGEDIEGISKASNGERASKGQMGYTGSTDTYLDVTTLSAGKYVIYLRGVNANKDARAFNFKVGDGVVFTEAIENGTWVYKTSEEFIVPVSSTLSYAGAGSSQSGLDWFYVVKTGDIPTEVSKSISAAGYATYCSEYPLDFTDSGLTAYIAAMNGNTVKFSPITSVPANTGVLLKGTEGSYNITVAASATDVSSNVLVGVTEDTEVAAGAFVLMNGTSGVGFYKTTNAFTVGANTAYLPASLVTEAKVRFIGFDDETATGIDAIETTKAADAVIYNVAGQRVNAAYKGIVIKNGQKFLAR